MVSWTNRRKTTNELREDQLNDPVLRTVHAWLQSKQKPEWADISHLSKVHKTYWGQWDKPMLRVNKDPSLFGS
jgi:hypothetical protein